MNKIYGFISQFAYEALETLNIISYDLLMVIGLISLVIYIFGWEKGKRCGMICPVIYIIIQIIVKVICHA